MIAGGILGGIEKARIQFTLHASDLEKRVHRESVMRPPAGDADPSVPSNPKTLKPGQSELIVQFNPSTLRFESSTHEVPVKGQLDNLSDVPNATNRAPSIVLNVDLIFDAVQNADAFHQDSLRLTPTDIATQIGAGLTHTIHDPHDIYNGKIKYTVMPQTKMIIGMATMATTVVFIWGKQSFEGTLESVRAKFEMFSPQGFPIRSRVEMRIQQLVQGGTNQDWADRYTNFFHNPAMLQKHGKSALQTQSILNLNGY
jgi:hypothetical protein